MDQQDRGAAIIHLEGKLPFRVGRVHGAGDSPRFQYPKKSDNEFDAVGREYPHPVSHGQTAGRQGGREPVAQVLDLPVGEGAVPVDDSGLVRQSLRHAFQQLLDRLFRVGSHRWAG